MEEIKINDLQVTRVGNRSVIFNDTYYATKRVANEILTGSVKSAFVQTINTPVGKEMKWLATPSRF